MSTSELIVDVVLYGWALFRIRLAVAQGGLGLSVKRGVGMINEQYKGCQYRLEVKGQWP